MNMITNLKGETVYAVGNPASPARATAETGVEPGMIFKQDDAVWRVSHYRHNGYWMCRTLVGDFTKKVHFTDILSNLA